MHYSEYKFDRVANREFYKTLRGRINEYFDSTGKSTKANRKMLIKSAVIILSFLALYAVLLFVPISSPVLFIAIWFGLGLVVAGIGLNIMHDANHGAFSTKEPINKALGYMMEMIGGSSKIWKLQHNVLHHSYTNIDGVDDDLTVPVVLRFSPHQRHRKIHRFQHIHAWFFYQFLTLLKVVYSDFAQAVQYHKLGLIKTLKEFTSIIAKVTVGKLFYLGYMLLLPLWLLDISPWWVICGFLVMHCVTGFCLSIVFQSAHILPDTSYPLPDETGTIENNWAIHQLLTTANFATQNKVFTWMVGGLNYQIEHHLFSNICHIHYPALAKIVQQTAAEHGIPYRSRKTFRNALLEHGRMLYILGRPQVA